MATFNLRINKFFTMDARGFRLPSIEIKEEPNSDEEAFDAMEFVELEGSKLIDQFKEEVKEAQEVTNPEEVISNLQTKLKEIALHNAEGDFMLQLTNQEYLAISQQKIFMMARLTKFVQGHCKKYLHLYKVCNGCGFKSIQQKDMDKHFEDGLCKSYYHALGTFNKPVYVLQCSTCFYRSKIRYNMLRHQEKLKHVGIRKVRADSQPGDEAEETGDESLVINSPEIIANLQSKLEKEAQKGEKDFLLKISKEEVAATCETKYSIVTKLSKVVRSYLNKDVKRFQVCNDCGFKTSLTEDMEQHLTNGTCSNYYDALGTCPKRNRHAQVLQCNECDFKTDQIGNMRRHLTMRGHGGYEKSIRPRSSVAKKSTESSPVKKPRKPAPVHVISCPHCGLQMQSTNLRRHSRLYCAALLKKTPKMSTDYDVPLDEYGSPVMECQDCGKSFGQYYYMERHLRNGCPNVKKVKKEAMCEEKPPNRRNQRRKVRGRPAEKIGVTKF